MTKTDQVGLRPSSHEPMGDGYLAIHDVDTGRGNIDTVLVGPAGLFTIEVKAHGGRIR